VDSFHTKGFYRCPFHESLQVLYNSLMRFKPMIFFLVVGSVAGFFVYREMTRVGNPGVISIGQQAPDFAIKGEDGREIKLSDYRGKVVFLNFWATWCGPCVEEMPEMELLKNTFKDRKFQMLAISVDTEWGAVKKFYEEHNLTIPAFLDPGHRVANLYKVFKFPETFLIDGNGNVVKHTWTEHWADPRLMSLVESLIEKQETTKHNSPQQAAK
jgi:peroxiredoxin